MSQKSRVCRLSQRVAQAIAGGAAPLLLEGRFDHTLRLVEIHRELMTAAQRWIIAPKLASVLSLRMAMRLNSLSLHKKFSMRCRHLYILASMAGHPSGKSGPWQTPPQQRADGAAGGQASDPHADGDTALVRVVEHVADEGECRQRQRSCGHAEQRLATISITAVVENAASTEAKPKAAAPISKSRRRQCGRLAYPW